MNDNFRDLKERIRKLDALLADGGSQDLSFAQAVSALRRAAKHGDRTRDPSPALCASACSSGASSPSPGPASSIRLDCRSAVTDPGCRAPPRGFWFCRTMRIGEGTP